MLSTPSLRSPVFLAIGAGAAIVGLLPWLITGARLPLQNLWAADTLPGQMPIALLPFSQYSVTALVAVILIGSTIAGIAGRSVAGRHPGLALLALMGGVLLVQLIALVQTAVTVSNGLSVRPEATAYLAGLAGGTVAAILLGIGLLALIARAPKAGALIGLSVAAIAFGSWLDALFFPITGIATSSPLTNALIEVVRFIPAVLIGVAIAWCGVATVGRVIAAILSLALLWVGPTVVTAVTAALGSRVLAHDPRAMVDYAVGVFRSVLGMPELWLPVVGVAVVVGAVGVVGVRVVGARGDGQPRGRLDGRHDDASSTTPPPE
jgi:hypothetical protein